MKFEKEHILEEGEEIISTIRKHWIVYVHDFFLHAFGCLLLIVAVYYFSSGDLFKNYSNETAYGTMVLILFVLIFWTSFFYSWTKDYFDVWYVTNKHIVAVNQKEILSRDEAFMELLRIQDVFFEKNGFLSNIFDYGQLKVQSAGTEQQFVMEYVKEVETVAHKIMLLRDEAHNKFPTPTSGL
ncbi:MAG: hypothetical protein JWN37_282 [Candidatus Nomurabacteria bacterium]|nr:hypothetical protein [Candidatus Nomurabacteria bacterium]